MLNFTSVPGAVARLSDHKAVFTVPAISESGAGDSGRKPRGNSTARRPCGPTPEAMSGESWCGEGTILQCPCRYKLES